jgi:hypothetical protein
MGYAVNITAVFGVKDDLGNPPSVVQIDERHAAVITVVRNPAVEHNMSAYISFSQFTAVMRSFQSHS